MTQQTKDKWPPLPVPMSGMPAAVTPLRQNGRKISRVKMAAQPLLGRLVISATDSSRNGGGARSIAELLKPGAGELGNVGKPLFNPVIERLDGKGMILSNYEIDSVEGEITQFVQVWLVRPLAGADR